MKLSEERRDGIRDAYASGMPIFEIMQKFKVCKSTITNNIDMSNRRSSGARKNPESKIQKALELYRQGESTAVICRRYDTNYYRHLTSEDIDERAKNGGEVTREISEGFNTPKARTKFKVQSEEKVKNNFINEICREYGRLV